jgi:hypothetical protein
MTSTARFAYISGGIDDIEGQNEVYFLPLPADAIIPSIAQQPSSQITAAGQAVAFSVTASGAPPLAYEWRRNRVELVDGGTISGAATAMLTINPVQPKDAGAYDVVVSNGCGSITSDVATLTVVASCLADIVTSGGSANVVDIDDLLAVISGWGPCPAPPAPCPANIATTGASATVVDIDDLLAVISAWGPCP